MMFSEETISRIRAAALGLTGLVCALYAALVLIYADAAPIPFWWPGLAGVFAALVIALVFTAAGRPTARRASDELYRAQKIKAERIGYWVALMLYPLFGLLLANDMITLELAFPVMGTLTGAAYLLPHAFLEGFSA